MTKEEYENARKVAKCDYYEGWGIKSNTCAELKRAWEAQQTINIATNVSNKAVAPVAEATASVIDQTNLLTKAVEGEIVSKSKAGMVAPVVEVKQDNTVLIIAGVALAGLLIWKGKALL